MSQSTNTMSELARWEQVAMLTRELLNVAETEIALLNEDASRPNLGVVES